MDDPTETVSLHGEPPRPLDPRDEALDRGAAVGRYVILDRIGSGGMGVVYAAYDPELDRRVALKLLRTDRFSSESGCSRLLREAQALARLTHPNVVAVHDAGTFGDRVFVAMELVEGETLQRWLEEGARSWREVLDRLLAAGRGLAAAHAAGLVHRDFKPENVLLGRDGRVRVVDFGLAKALADAAEEPLAPDSGGELASPLTAWGAVLGTPAYMAPEQLRGIAADARSDQFSFCVALYEALYGERPFVGKGPREIAESVARGVAREAPAGTKVPGWLRAVALRGLKADPEERYPGMDDLLRDLERDPAAVRRRWLLAAGALLTVGAVFSSLGYLQAHRAQLCGGAEEKLAGVWDAGEKRAVHAGFLATRLPFSEGVWRGVETGIDRYTRDWAEARRRACEATRRRGEQSEDLLDRKMFCLDQRLREVGALTDLFTHSDAKIVERAVDAVNALPDLSGCQTGALLERVPPPRASRKRVEALQSELAGAKALQRAGKYRDALARAEALKGRVMAVPFRPLQAEMLFLLGKLHLGLGEYRTSEEELYEAVWAAQEGRDAGLEIDGWRELVYNVGLRQARYGEARRLDRQAQAALARTGGGPRAEMSLLNTEAAVLTIQGEYRQAVQKLERAQTLSERIDPGGPGYGILLNLGGTYRDMGAPERAIPVLRRALGIAERTVGSNHPHVAGLNFNLGLCLSDLGRYGEAAGPLERALALRERLLGRDHPEVADTLVAIGSNRTQRGHPELALPILRRALAVYEVKAPGTPNEWAMAHYELGEAARRLGRHAEALEHERLAIRCIEARVGAGSDYLLLPLETLGALYLDQGRPDLAVPPLERAAGIYERQPPVFLRWSAETRFLLARALWETGRDRPRALDLARRAREDSMKMPESARIGLADLNPWLIRYGG
jgi:tetratricopeptide (TPR) repeat protein/predicted Ser/Thr protein kinase